MIAALQQACDRALLEGRPAVAPCDRVTGRWIIAAAVIGSSLVFIDGTVANVALPAVQAEMGGSAGDAQWVIESYALVLAALLLTGGALGDQYGRRRVFIAGIALFTAASVGCAAAGGIGSLIAWRAVQGAGAALLVPGSLSLITASFPEAERGAAIGTWSGLTSIAAALGPLVGGALIDHASWRWAFLLNVPAALGVIVITLRHVPESRGEGRSLDVRGAVLATLCLGCIVYALIEAGSAGWMQARVIGSLAAGLVAGVLFVVVEARQQAPMLPLSLFVSHDFSAANLLTLLLYAALGGGLYFLPLTLIQVHGYTATGAGAALLPFIFVVSVLSRAAGDWSTRHGARLPLTLGPLCSALGFALFALPGTTGDYASTFLVPALVLGLGMGITVAPLTTVVMNAWGEQRAGISAAVNNAVSRTAGVLAIALFGVVAAAVFNRALDARLPGIALNEAALELLAAVREQLAGAVLPDTLDPQQRALLREAVNASYVSGFRGVMAICALLSLVAAAVGRRFGGRPAAAPSIES
jgi:EmrB/QacA subfamily drug resistance transporter